MKGVFLVKSVEKDIVQNKGVRAFILERILNDPEIKKGNATNLGDGRTVEVSLEGNPRAVRKFIERLKIEITNEFGNPAITFTEFEENEYIEIPSLHRSSQALVLNQLQKGINVQFKILESQSKLLESQSKLIESQTKMADSQAKIQGSQSEIAGSLKTLPKDIARELKAGGF